MKRELSSRKQLLRRAEMGNVGVETRIGVGRILYCATAPRDRTERATLHKQNACAHREKK